MGSKSGDEPGRDGEARIGGYLVGDIQCCVDEEVDQYLERFEELEAGGHRFNWASALFCERWLAFRMMWKEALALLAASLLLDSAAQLALGWIPMALLDRIRYTMMVFALLGLLKAGCMGQFGDRIYWRHVRREIDYWRSHTGIGANRMDGGGPADHRADVQGVEEPMVKNPVMEGQDMAGKAVAGPAEADQDVACHDVVGQTVDHQDVAEQEMDEVRRKLKEDGGASMAVALFYCLVQWVILYALSLVAPSLFWYMRVY